MNRKDVVIGKTYTHPLDGKLWQVKVTAIEYDKDRQRHLWTGTCSEGTCWGWVSELQEVFDSRS